ncbi:hypothetical protein LINGRAHAP2_LOCUS33690 [Linum grandiflorum]
MAAGARFAGTLPQQHRPNDALFGIHRRVDFSNVMLMAHCLQNAVFKCNVDGALFTECGAVIRDHDGNFVASWHFATPGLLEAREVEAQSLLQAIQWVVQTCGIPNVQFETDCQELVHAINDPLKDQTEFGTLVQLCTSKLRLQPFNKVLFVRRNGNKSAHELAQRSCFLTAPVIGSAPPEGLCNDSTHVCMMHY